VVLYLVMVYAYPNVKLCFRATRQELSAALYLQKMLIAVIVICSSILAACSHLRDESDRIPRVICGLILTENDNLR